MKKNRFFDFDASTREKLNDPGSIPFKHRYLVAHYQKLENIRRDLKRLPSVEEFFFLQTSKQFNAFTFIPFIVKSENIRQLKASTYSISIRVVEGLIELYDQGLIEEIQLLVSDSLIKRNPVTLDKIDSMAKNRANISIDFTWNHSKVTLAKTDSSHFVIEGSGNWSENAAIEQYLFANSKGLFEFRNEIFEKWYLI